MPEADLFLLFIRKLNDVRIPYMVTGSIAGMLYGEPRVTHDVDLVLALEPGPGIARMTEYFPLDDFYCPPEEIMLQEAMRSQRGHFNLIHHQSGFKADIYLANRDRFHEWALSEREQINVDGVVVWVAPIEYVVVRKLQFFREGGSEKHIGDILAMMRVSADRVRPNVLEKWLSELRLQPLWNERIANDSTH